MGTDDLVRISDGDWPEPEQSLEELPRGPLGAVTGFDASKVELDEHLKTEAALQDRTESYDLVVRGAGGGIWDWDVPNRTVYYSPRWKELRGFEPDELGDSEEEWSSRIHPDDAPRVRAAVEAHFAGRTEFFEAEYRILCKDGSFKWIWDRGLARRDGAGRVIRMAGSESDITARKQAEEALRGLARRLQSVREEERARLSRELHDELGQLSSALKMEIALCAKAAPASGTVSGRVPTMLQLVETAIETVRWIASDLHPRLLDDLGLNAAIEWQTSEFERRTGLKCTLEMDELTLDGKQSMTILRVLQESLTNIYRHALASKVHVSLSRAGERIELSVHDDGRGMDLRDHESVPALGLLGMRERAAALGGRLEILSAPGAGTTVRLDLPRSLRTD